MDADEKLRGLKMAYTDVLLGISKEAGARVMELERKSARCKYEMEATRDEGVRLLEHLKHMMESQSIESQAKAFNQQKKIDELEAQLQEAEDIVSDLRGELRQVEAELERVAKAKNLNNPILETQQMNTDNMHSLSENCQLNRCGNCQYVPSIILRGKETGLYRNGCTQRIHACDQNSLNQDLSLSEKSNVIVENKEGSEELEKKPLVDIKLGGFDSLSKDVVNPSENEGNLVEVSDGKIVHEGNVEIGGLELNFPKGADGLSVRAVRERDFRCTFQRRRKRQTLSKSEAGDSLEMGKKAADGGTGDQNPEEIKCSFSQESIWMAQIARQLISLSESKR